MNGLVGLVGGVVSSLGLMFSQAQATAVAEVGAVERVPFKASFAVAGRVIFYGSPDYTQQYLDRCHMAPVNLIQGAGDASYLGTMTDVQSHCLGTQDPTAPNALPFFGGAFIFTSPDGRTITGEYHGRLVPTNTSIPPTMGPPQGAWIIEGLVCISGGTVFRNIVNDCVANLFFPARGITILNPLTGDTNESTLFLDQTIGMARD
jgi:hypothetical protein